MINQDIAFKWIHWCIPTIYWMGVFVSDHDLLSMLPVAIMNHEFQYPSKPGQLFQNDIGIKLQTKNTILYVYVFVYFILFMVVGKDHHLYYNVFGIPIPSKAYLPLLNSVMQ